jgi:DNA polymerase-3 subunit delta
MAGKGPAGPLGGAVLRSTLAALAQGWPPGLTVLTGEDLFHLDEAQRALLARLVPEGTGGAALTVFGDRKVEIGTVLAAACSVGMFSPRRVVLVRDVEALDGKPGPLAGYASSPPGESYLIVRAPKLDARRGLHRELLEAGRTVSFRPPSQDDAEAVGKEASELAKERGLSLDRDAIAFLVEVSTGDFYRLSSELDKIRDWRGKEARGAVTFREARDVAAGGGALSGWELADAMLARETGKALEATRRLAEAGEQQIRTLGGLAWRARAMLQVKAAIESGSAPEEAARSVWAGVPAARLLAGLRLWPLGDLLDLPGRFLRTDRTLKSRGIDKWAVMESLADDLTGRGARAGRERR